MAGGILQRRERPAWPLSAVVALAAAGGGALLVWLSLLGKWQAPGPARGLLFWLVVGGSLGAFVGLAARTRGGWRHWVGFARFKIERQVAQGGMGVVYRALDRATGQPVALKLLIPRDEPPAGAAAGGPTDQRFSREIGILAGLDHPRVARYVAHGRAETGQSYLAMQWLDGEDLKVALARGPLSLADSMRVLVGTAEGLAAVHAQGIIHRDLKPANLFLRRGSAADLVLLDFGLARHLDGASDLTRSAAVLGTPQYMSPEQAGSATQLRPATDLFALGCIFYECLTGRTAFGASNMVGVLARILFDTPEPVRLLRPAVPQAWQDLLGRMLSKDPAARPADAAALLQELRALPPVPEAMAEALPPTTPATAAKTEGGDHVLVCVVLATLPPDVAASLEQPADGSGTHAGGSSTFDSVRSALGRSGCALERMANGSLLATVFPRPSAADQAHIAAHCALSLRERWPRARIAVTTGRAPLQQARVGEAVDRAARLLESGSGVDEGIRLDSLTGGLLEPRFVTEHRGEALLLLGEKADLDQGRLLLGKPTPCVGREVELGQLEGLMATVVEETAPKAAVVLGPPGIGKSRLRHELLRRLRERHSRALVLVGYGDPLNAGSPYVIVADALRRQAGIRVGDEPAAARAALTERLGALVDRDHRRRVTEFLGEMCGTPFPDEDSAPLRAARRDHRVMGEQIALAFLDWVSAECAERPLVFVLEDMQWGDSLTVKLMSGVLRDVKQRALLVLVLGRPEIEETFPRLLNESRALSLSLRPLSERASEALVKGVLGETLAREHLRKMVQMAGGNALFLEELIRAAAEGQAGDVPETVVAMLQARLSRLPAESRMVLRAASILGETFWKTSIEQICRSWSDAEQRPEELDAWLTQLVEAELVEKPRTSRFPGEVQYNFRHALVCEAAAGLLAEGDRVSGHRAAGHWLEAMGETDGIVLARHAEEAAEANRAVTFYLRAAEQSVALHDFAEALTRAEKGVRCGAQGEALGISTSIQASALYSMGRWVQAAEVGMAALTLLPAGGLWWCDTVEKLLQVLPNANRFPDYIDLSERMLRTNPPPEARDAYLRALNVQLLGYAISASHAKGRACLAHIEKVDAGSSDNDIVARGYARLWRAVFAYIAETDMPRALALAQQAVRDLTESQVMYRLSLTYLIQSFIHWGLGQHAESEQTARDARAVAGEIRDDYHFALGNWYLGLALADQDDPAKQDEALRCAEAVAEAHISPQYDNHLPRVITGRVALMRGQWAKAAEESHLARIGIPEFVPYAIISWSYEVQALVGAGKAQDAAACARDGLATLDKIDGPICTEVMFRVAAAEALWASGDRDEARRLLARARVDMDGRAAQMVDLAVRRGYLNRREENRRLVELERAWASET